MAEALGVELRADPGITETYRGRHLYYATELCSVLEFERPTFETVNSLLAGEAFSDCAARLKRLGFATSAENPWVAEDNQCGTIGDEPPYSEEDGDCGSPRSSDGPRVIVHGDANCGRERPNAPDDPDGDCDKPRPGGGEHSNSSPGA